MVVELSAPVVVSHVLVVNPEISSVDAPSGRVVIVAVIEVVRESNESVGSVVVEVGRRGPPMIEDESEVDDGIGNVIPTSVEEILDVIGNGKPIVDDESTVDDGIGNMIPTSVEDVLDVVGKGRPIGEDESEVDGIGKVIPSSVEEVLDVIGSGSMVRDDGSVVDDDLGNVMPESAEEVLDVMGNGPPVVDEESEVDEGIGNVIPTSVEEVLDVMGNGLPITDEESEGTPLVIAEDGLDTVVSPPVVLADSDGMPLVVSDVELDAVISSVVDVDSNDVSLVSEDDGFVIAVVSVMDGGPTKLDVVVPSVIDGDPGKIDVVDPSLVDSESDGVLLGLGVIDPSLGDDSSGMLLGAVDRELGTVDPPADVELADVRTGVESIEFQSVELGYPVLPSVTGGVLVVAILVRLGEATAEDPESETGVDVFGLSGLDCWVLEAESEVVDAPDVGGEIIDSLLELYPSPLIIVLPGIPLSLEDAVDVGTLEKDVESEGMLLAVDCETDNAGASVAVVDSDIVLPETGSDDGIVGVSEDDVESDGAVLVTDCETVVAGTPMDELEPYTVLPEIVSEIDDVGRSEIEVESDKVLLELGSSVDDIGTPETEVESNGKLLESAGVSVGTPELALVGV
jgi:hypothetical protein